MGIVVEYADQSGTPTWEVPARLTGWDYGMFARPADPSAPAPDQRIELTFDKIPGGRGGFNRWTINGKSWPDTDPIMLETGKRTRLVLHNLSGDMHPIHLHRHTFEVTTYNRRAIAGLMKDVVALRGRQDCEIDFVADNPGPSLFHCHMQDHQDFGFMVLAQYK
jgi:FtsP/CotA-like multicopper oxidase with cupredoxin domain